MEIRLADAIYGRTSNMSTKAAVRYWFIFTVEHGKNFYEVFS
jgi:hypothetical protein